MKNSSLTLAGALNLIPKVLFQRYGGTGNYAFAIAKANAIFQDIEKEFDSEYYLREHPLVLVDGMTDYTIPTTIRKVQGIYDVPNGWVVPDTLNPINVSFFGDKIRLKHTPIVDSSADFTGTISGVTSKNKFASASFAALTDNSLKSSLCQFYDLSTTLTHNRIILSNASSSIVLNGELPELPVAGSDTYKIYRNYFLIKALDYIPRLTSESTVLPIPIDWEELFQAGLRFYYDKQTDQESVQSRVSGQEYSRLLKKASSDEKKKQGEYPMVMPRDIPDFNLQ